MSIETVTVGAAVVVRVVDRALDAHAAGPFKDSVAALIDAGLDRIVINMKQVELLDSTGLGAIVTCRKKLGPRGSIVLCEVDARVLGVLKLTRLDRVFKIYPTEDAATAALAGLPV
jgi:anti-sigma B factor antagonist